MSVTLSARPVEDPDQLALIADTWTPTGKPFADAFRDACRTVANEAGYINPNHVRVALMDRDDYSPQRYSALWSKGVADGYLEVTELEVPISGPGSRGNGNKNVPLRRWVGGAA